MMKMGFMRVSKRLHMMFNSSSDGIYILDDEGRIVAKCNKMNLIQIVVRSVTDGKLKLLVLVKGIKRIKDGKISVSDAMFLKNFRGENVLRLKQNKHDFVLRKI